MEEEIETIEKNHTWTLTSATKNYKPISLKRIFKTKTNPKREIVRHKARLVAKRYVQKISIIYEEIFTLVAWMDIIKVIIAFVAQHGWKLYHLDVKSAFLNGKIEEVYVKQLEDFIQRGKENFALKLKRALYGLKQAPRAWYMKLDKCLQTLGFIRNSKEHADYRKFSNEIHLIVGVYINDLILTRPDEAFIEEFKQKMMKNFKMSDHGLLTSYMGIKVE